MHVWNCLDWLWCKRSCCRPNKVICKHEYTSTTLQRFILFGIVSQPLSPLIWHSDWPIFSYNDYLTEGSSHFLIIKLLQVWGHPGLNATEAATPGLTIRVFFPVGDTAGCHRRSCATKCYGLCGRVGVWGGGGWVGLLRKLNWKGRSRGFPKLDLGRQHRNLVFRVRSGRVKRRGCCQGFIDILRWSSADENSDSGFSFELR